MMKRTFTVALLASVAAFNNKGGWKLDADGKIEMKDGNPVWVDANGGEAVMNGDSISRLNGEAKTLRERAEAAETKARAFDGLDPAKAREALDKLKDIDTSKLIDSGKLDDVRRQISGEYEAKLSEKDKALQDLQQRYDGSQINAIFSNSDFVRERVAVPRDMFQDSFGKHFKVEDGKIVAYDRAGNRVMSKKNIGDFADASEALELLVDAHPQKDTILRADAGGGTGSGGGGGNRGGGRTVKRADLAQMQPHQAADVASKARSGEITIVD